MSSVPSRSTPAGPTNGTPRLSSTSPAAPTNTIRDGTASPRTAWVASRRRSHRRHAFAFGGHPAGRSCTRAPVVPSVHLVALGDADPTIYGLPVDGPTIESEIDRLCGLPLTEFTKERDALARRLPRRWATRRRRNDRRAAQARARGVGRQQARAREQRADVKALVDAAAEIRAGKPHADDRFRATADELVRAGARRSPGPVAPATDAVVRDVATTLGQRPPQSPTAAPRAPDRAGRGDGLRRDGRSCRSASRAAPPPGEAGTAARPRARRGGAEGTHCGPWPGTAARAGGRGRRARGAPPPRRCGRGREERRRRRGRARDAALDG